MIRVLIADDHAVVRQGLKQILGDTPEMLVAGEATNGQEALDKVRAEAWDVVVLDISMPDRSGLDILKQLRSERPKLPVLVLSMYSEDQFAVRVLKAGASGYLTKDSAADELVKAIRKVVSGGTYVSAFLAEKLAFEIGTDSNRLPHETLSDREFQVLRRDSDRQVCQRDCRGTLTECQDRQHLPGAYADKDESENQRGVDSLRHSEPLD